MQPGDALVRGEEALSRRERRVLLAVVTLGTLGAGTAFVYKIAEFMFTMGSTEVQGFADVPVGVYFAVAAGWLSLLVWCFLTGQFNGVEQSKMSIITQEAEYERRGE